MIALDVSPDRYGAYARVAHVADLVEARVIATAAPLSKSTIQELCVDNGWKKADFYLLGRSPLDEDEAEEHVFEWVVAELDRRQSCLGPAYPLVLDANSISLRTSAHSRYAKLLGLTLAHAYWSSLPAGQSFAPKRDFEDFVGAFMHEKFDGRVLRTGANRGNFAHLVNRLGEQGFAADPTSVVHSLAANDDGVDVVAWCWEPDRWVGHAVLIVQATVAQSGAWQAKAAEQPAPRWSRYMGIDTNPQCVLAVPHAIGPECLELISSASCRPAVLDRLRLCRCSAADLDASYLAFVESLSLDVFA